MVAVGGGLRFVGNAGNRKIMAAALLAKTQFDTDGLASNQWRGKIQQHQVHALGFQVDTGTGRQGKIVHFAHAHHAINLLMAMQFDTAGSITLQGLQAKRLAAVIVQCGKCSAGILAGDAGPGIGVVDTQITGNNGDGDGRQQAGKQKTHKSALIKAVVYTIPPTASGPESSGRVVVGIVPSVAGYLSMKMLHMLLLSLLFLSPVVAASPMLPADDDFLPVEQAYQLSIEFDGPRLWLVWQMADNYYLYRHGFAHQWHVNGQPLAVEAILPGGIVKQDDYFGEVEVYYRQAALELTLPQGLAPDDELLLTASSQGCADAGLCYPPYSQTFVIDRAGSSYRQVEPAAPSPAAGPALPAAADPSLAWVLLAALLGGLILNLMPCVFPVLSIKALQLVREQNVRQMRLHGLLYMAGVVASFLLIAALLLFLRSAGNAIGWGFQLQNPWLIACLVYLFVVLAMNMAGLVQFGLRWMGVGQSLTERGDAAAAFFTGVLAVVVASPCTAPFMGAALGYALVQPAASALLVFVALGVGMALPLTLVSMTPALSRWLPRPGPWMERLKQFFVFPLLLTAIWLLWVLGNQSGSVAMSMILLGCVLLLFAFWCFRGGLLWRASGLLALLLALSLPFSDRLAVSDGQPAVRHAYETFSEARLADLRSQGVAVFVDLTADWCITCLANEKSTLHTDEVQQAFRDAGIVYMVGDWTRYNPEITALLGRYQRSGIPLYLLYPAEADAPALILPQLLSKRIVLDAIDYIK